MAPTDQPGVLDDQLRNQIKAASDGKWPDPDAIANSRNQFIDDVWGLPADRVLTTDELEFITNYFDIEAPKRLTLNDVYGLLQDLNDQAADHTGG